MGLPIRALPALSLALAGTLAWLTLTQVNLKPRVDEHFFFSHDSTAYRDAKVLERRFSSQELLMVTAHAPDIASAGYREQIETLTQRLEQLPRVVRVTSLTRGPENLADVRNGPLWRRLLLPDPAATNLVLVVDASDPEELIGGVEGALRAAQRPDFELSLTGVPYVAAMIGRNLQQDFRNFSLTAVVVLSALMLVLFRSWAVLLGSLTACCIAASATLLVQHLFGGRIGLLTANLVTVSFVLTQSHIVFMTNNWRVLRPQCATAEEALRRTLAQTLTASSWCMVAALLGFGSLWYVEAQPLRELGYGGTLATACALLSAYVCYPAFLLWAPPRGQARALRLAGLPHPAAAIATLCAALALGAGALRIDSDPSLFSYFDPDSEVYRSLALVDPHGGSSPLSLAVRRTDRARLDSSDSYDRMWQLQRALQKDPSVGTVVSLPVLMAEAQRSTLAKLLPWNWVLDVLSRPSFDRVARGFVTDDRTQGLYLLRMREDGRHERRTEVIARLSQHVAAAGFEVTAVGGTYALQGRLADLVTRSLFEGLAGLLLAVGLIAFAVTRSWPAALAMLGCAATVPSVALGLFGLCRIPLDIIATPAVNVAIGVAVDSMIHLGAAWRRARATLPPPLAVAAARQEQSGGILAFSAVVIAGFAIFAVSSFPPTQRFGVAVIIGAATAGAMALWIFPALLTYPYRRR